MNTVVHSPWKVIVTGILGLIVGYALVIAQHGSSAFANTPQCPMMKKGTCNSTDCMKDSACTGANCAHDCPECTKEAATI